MPRFSLLKECPDDLYWAVLAVFGFDATNLRRHEIPAPDPDTTGPDLDPLRPELLAIHRAPDRCRCVPETWSRKACLQLLRHLLAPRGLALESRFVWRRGRGSQRMYSVVCPAEAAEAATRGVTRVFRPLDLS